MCLYVVFITQSQWKLSQLWLIMSSGLPPRRKYRVKLRIRLWTRHFIVSMSLICTNFGWDKSRLQINFAYNIDQIIGCIVGSGGGPYLFGELEELLQMNTSYIGIFFVLRETRCIGCQMRWFTFNSSNLCLLISWHPRNWNYNIWEIHMQFLYHMEIKYQMICHCLHLIPGCLIKVGQKF